MAPAQGGPLLPSGEEVLRVKKVAILGCLDSLLRDRDRWLAAYRALVEYIGGQFNEELAQEEFVRLEATPDGKVNPKALFEFHNSFDALLSSAMAAQDIRHSQMVAMLEQLSRSMKVREDDLRSVLSASMQLPPKRADTGSPSDRMAELRRWWQQGSGKEFSELKTFIFDCDGVLWNVQDPAHELAPEPLQQSILDKVNGLIRNEEKRVLFLTNNSHETRLGYVKKLSKLGIDFGDLEDETTKRRAEQSIVTSGFTTAKLLKQMHIQRPFVLTSTAGLLEELELLGISGYVSTFDTASNAPKENYLQALDKNTVSALMDEHDNVDAIVVGWDFCLNALKIGVAVNCLKWSQEEAENDPAKKPIPLITCSSDSSGVLGSAERKGRKIRAFGNGAMGNAIASCFDPPHPQIFCGKPSPTLLKMLSDSEADGGYGVDFKTAVMIGDTIETDIAFANGGGMRSLLVLTGVNSLDDMEQESEPHRKSTWILPSFADI